MRCDQIALYANNDAQADLIKAQFGLTNAEWIQDTVTARSKVFGFEEGENVAELQFNYSLGIELEIIKYIKGRSWHDNNPIRIGTAPFISHVGLHLDENEDFPSMKGARLVQETFTLSHTSEYLTKPGSPGFGRKYHYQIFELSPGSYIKYIKRINP